MRGPGRDLEHRREIVLRDDGELREVGYPSSIQPTGGTLVTVYHIHGPDGIRHIATTRWQ